MQAILEWAGYTAYQAECLAPVLCALLAAMAAAAWVNWWCATAQRRAWKMRQRRIRRATRKSRRRKPHEP